jgi:predicted DNA-binding protein
MRFSREDDREQRTVLLSVRLTKSQVETLDALAVALGVGSGGKAEVIRRAIDHFIEHDRTARQVARQRRT